MLLNVAAETIFKNLPISAKTLSTYRSIYNLYIFPALGSLQLEQVKRETIQQLIRNLPPQTAATTLSVLRTIFREAIDNSYCEHSPAATVRRPRIQVVPRNFIPLNLLLDLEFPPLSYRDHISSNARPALG
jgi:site-specific recombinase XerC